MKNEEKKENKMTAWKLNSMRRTGRWNDEREEEMNVKWKGGKIMRRGREKESR